MDCSLPGCSAHVLSQERIYWSGLPFPSPGDLPNPGTEHLSPALQVDSLPLRHQRSPIRRNLKKIKSSHPPRWYLLNSLIKSKIVLVSTERNRMESDCLHSEVTYFFSQALRLASGELTLPPKCEVYKYMCIFLWRKAHRFLKKHLTP